MLDDPPIVRAVDGQLTPRRSAGWQVRLVRRLILADALSAVVAALIALNFRFGAAAPAAYVLLTLALPIVWVAMCAGTRTYERRFLGTGSEEFRRVFDAGIRLIAATALLSYASKLEVARSYVLVALPLTVGLSLLGRYGSRQVLHRNRGKGRCLHRVVVVGGEGSCGELIRQFRREPFAGFSVVGVCADRSGVSKIEGIEVIGSSTTIVQALKATGADTVAIGSRSDLTQQDLRRLSWELEGSGVSLVVAPSVADVTGPRIHIRPVAGLPLLHLEQPEFTGARRLVKGTADRVAALLVLLICSPILLAIALAVRVSSTGPALFRQTRVGMDGRDFTIYKFRSMYADAEARLGELASQNQSDGLLFKMKNDPRVTPVGRFLRRLSLDELPQLLNVLKGDMSLVGPRPPLPREVAEYRNDVRRRLLVKPGLTGLWQVSGRSDLSWDESVRLDLHYVENWSLALDAMIMWKTFFAVVRSQGAY